MINLRVKVLSLFIALSIWSVNSYANVPVVDPTATNLHIAETLRRIGIENATFLETEYNALMGHVKTFMKTSFDIDIEKARGETSSRYAINQAHAEAVKNAKIAPLGCKSKLESASSAPKNITDAVDASINRFRSGSRASAPRTAVQLQQLSLDHAGAAVNPNGDIVPDGVPVSFCNQREISLAKVESLDKTHNPFATCAGKELNAGKSSDFSDADSNPSALFSGINAKQFMEEDDPSKKGRGETLSFNPNQAAAALKFLENLGSGADNAPALPPVYTLSKAGAEYEALRRVYHSRISIGDEALSAIFARRVPSVILFEGGKTIVDIYKADPIMSEFANNYFLSKTKHLSQADRLNFEIQSRRNNQKWIKSLVGNNATTPMLLKEIALMMSMQLELSYIQIRDNERLLAVNAVNSMSQVRQEMMPLIKAAEKRAMTPSN